VQICVKIPLILEVLFFFNTLQATHTLESAEMFSPLASQAVNVRTTVVMVSMGWEASIWISRLAWI